MRSLNTIDLADAEAIIEEATRAATEEGVAVHVAVVDAFGYLIAFRRMDGANFIAGDIALAKALTAAGTRAATKDLAAKTFPGEPGWGLQHMAAGRLTTLAGGVPICREHTVLGAVGVSGASVAQDERIAVVSARI